MALNSLADGTALPTADKVDVRARPAGAAASGYLVASELNPMIEVLTDLRTRAQDVPNVKDYGAVGDGSTDDTTAIQSTVGDGVVEVFLPTGTYSVSRIGDFFALAATDNLVIRGAGPGLTTIRLADAQPTVTRTLKVDGVSNVVIRDLAIDGNAAGNPDGNADQNPCLFIFDASNVLVENCHFYGAVGDGVTIGGSAATGSTDITVRNCLIENCGRAGIVIEQASRVKVVNNTIISGGYGGCIDMEPFESVSHEDCLIDGNTLVFTRATAGYAVTLWGEEVDYPYRDIRFTNNRVKCTQAGGHVGVMHAENVVISGNHFDLYDRRLWAQYLSESLVISGNTFEGAADYALVLMLSTAEAPTRVEVTGNVFSVTGGGINVEGGTNIGIVGNTLESDGGDTAIRLFATGDMENTRVIGNTTRNFSRALSAASNAGQIKGLVIAHNIADTLTSASFSPFYIDSAAPLPSEVVVAGNVVRNGTTAGDFSLPAGLTVRTGGTRDTGQYSCTGTPEGQVTASIGAICVRRDGGTSTTLYVKESGTRSATGWAAK